MTKLDILAVGDLKRDDDGKILEATRKGWSAESIQVRQLAGMYYDRYDFVMRYTGHGGGEKYTIEETTDQ